jgi:FtsZ-interacting cell division protein YlmF
VNVNHSLVLFPILNLLLSLLARLACYFTLWSDKEKYKQASKYTQRARERETPRSESEQKPSQKIKERRREGERERNDRQRIAMANFVNTKIASHASVCN